MVVLAVADLVERLDRLGDRDRGALDARELLRDVRVLREEPLDPAGPGDDELTLFCRDRLAAFKVPAEFVRVAALPRTASGKIRRAELRASLEDQ